jgi:hypothetical protein
MKSEREVVKWLKKRLPAFEGRERVAAMGLARAFIRPHNG